MEISVLVILFTFSQGERVKLHLHREPTIQASVFPNHIIEHPTGGRTTHHKYDVALLASP